MLFRGLISEQQISIKDLETGGRAMAVLRGLIARTFAKISQERDIVMVDQRCAGRSI
jgi:hypothetical protein